MKIYLLAVGRLREPYLDDVQHYKKMLTRYVKLEMIYLKHDNDIAKHIPQRSYVCVLDSSGKQYSSTEFSELINSFRTEGRDICFIVGGHLGLADDPERPADLKLSLGMPTLPHQLAQVVLLEQIYRSYKILLGEPYHY